MRKAIYPIVRKLSGPLTDVEGILVNKPVLPKGPKVFSVTHTYSREDIAWAISLVGEQSYLLTNAYRELMCTSDGIALWASGIILVDRYDKDNRRASIQKAKRLLQMKGNVMVFPEAVWNMSENQLVRKLYPGVYRIAAAANVPIIPVSTMMYEKKLYVNIGTAIFCQTMKQQDALIQLRDSMASLKWAIMERYGKDTREHLLGGLSPEEYWKNHIDSYIAKQTVYEHEEESNAHYMDRDDIEQAQAFEHLQLLSPKQENAFLFNKRLL
ncbi:MAG: 1-acyl-sn-glycerol-3-phosphate acyltransferase [Lachnospiraceae bacterium]|nr:1-acyl-sn-glycerol-3-phosphate acyltransferase [Lachnospiraceae bacterium]